MTTQTMLNMQKCNWCYSSRLSLSLRQYSLKPVQCFRRERVTHTLTFIFMKLVTLRIIDIMTKIQLEYYYILVRVHFKINKNVIYKLFSCIYHFYLFQKAAATLCPNVIGNTYRSVQSSTVMVVGLETRPIKDDLCHELG